MYSKEKDGKQIGFFHCGGAEVCCATVLHFLSFPQKCTGVMQQEPVTLNLRGTVPQVDRVPQKLALTIKLPERTYRLEAETEAELDEWIDSVTVAAFAAQLGNSVFRQSFSVCCTAKP